MRKRLVFSMVLGLGLLKTEREMYIHADGSLRYQDVITVMSLASKAGADKVGLITDPMSSREETGP